MYCRRVSFSVLILIGMLSASPRASGAPACDTNSPTPEAAIAECTRLIGSGQLKGRELSNTYNKRAILHQNRKEYDRAIADYDLIIKTDPKFALAYSNRGFSYRSKGDYDRAIADFDQAIGLDPKLARAYAGRGWTYNLKHDYDRAIADYDEAIKLDPNPRAINDRGRIYRNKGDHDRAIAELSEAIRLDPKAVHPYYNRGLAWRDKKDSERAIADFSEAIKIDPKYAAAYSDRGWTYNLKRDYDRAIADYDEAIKIDPKPGAFSDRGRIYRNKGEYDRAIADFDQALRLDPKAAYVYVNRGLAYRDKNDSERAIADFSDAIKINPKHVSAYTDRGWTYNLKRDFERAIADYDEAIKLDPKTAWIYNNRGLIWRNKGDFDRALADYAEAIRLDPKYSLPYANRGRLIRAKGDLVRAIADFTEALRLDPDFTAAITDRGLAYEAKGDHAKAQADFRAALALPPKYDNGKSAQESARTRLALLAGEKPSSTLATSGRIALVIGNGAYKHVAALTNPANDARAIAKALREIGFDVMEGINLDRRSQEQQVRDFLRRAAVARVALVYYAGHGMQVDGKNYLIPVDAKLSGPADLPSQTLELGKILNGLDDETRTNIVILDACRDNPLPKSANKGSGGLAPVSTVGYGTLVVYATAPDNVALDGDGSNSPFTTALVNHIRTPGLEVRQMVTRVRLDVAKATGKKQIPWDNSSLLGDVYLASGSKSASR